jgi:hypothetical protein
VQRGADRTHHHLHPHRTHRAELDRRLDLRH